jgi:hypothetical protein
MPNKVFYTDHFKWLSVGIFCFSLFVLYAALHASEDQTLIAYLVAGFFLAGSAYLLYQAFLSFSSMMMHSTLVQKGKSWSGQGLLKKDIPPGEI